MKKYFISLLAIVLSASFSTSYAKLQYNNSDLQKFADTNSCEDCDLSGGILSFNHSGAKLDNANLSSVTFSDARGINFSRASMRNVDFSGIQTINAQTCNFASANLANANLSQGMFIQGDFSRANLRNANFTKSALSNANFSGADVTGAHFDGAFMEWANFFGAKGAQLTNVNLCHVTLPDGSIGACD